MCGCINSTLSNKPQTEKMNYQIEIQYDQLFITNKNTFTWHNCSSIVNGKYHDYVNFEDRIDKIHNVTSGENMGIRIRPDLQDKYGQKLYEKENQMEFHSIQLDCFEGIINERF